MTGMVTSIRMVIILAMVAVLGIATFLFTMSLTRWTYAAAEKAGKAELSYATL